MKQKKILYYLSDGNDSKECLSKNDLLDNVEKLIDYFANKDDLDVVMVTVAGDVDAGNEDKTEAEEDLKPIELDFATLQSMPDMPLDQDLAPLDLNKQKIKPSVLEEANLK